MRLIVKRTAWIFTVVLSAVILAFYWKIWGEAGLNADAEGTSGNPIQVYQIALCVLSTVVIVTFVIRLLKDANRRDKSG